MTATWTTPATVVDGTLYGATWFNQYLRDNLDWLKGRPVAASADFDGTVYSTTSSSFQDTGLAATITTTGGRVLVVAWGSVSVSNSSTAALVTLYEDGVNKGDATEGMQRFNIATSAVGAFAIAYITPTAPTAAAHTWKLYLRGTDGVQSAIIKQCQIWTIEIGA